MKKIFIMGAVGAICIEATRDLIETSGFDEFLLADIDEQKLDILKRESNDPRVRILKINASDMNEVGKAIKGYDLVMDGLAFEHMEPTIKACLKNKIPRIDLVGRKFSGLGNEFQKACVLWSKGVGASPGLTDIMTKYAVDQCDKVDEIYISWASFRPMAISPGLLKTTFWEMDPKEKRRAYYSNGNFYPQYPLQESKIVEFEHPYGKLPVYYVPHSETDNLSQLVPGVKIVKTMGTWPPEDMDLLKQLLDYGIYEKETISYQGQEINTLDLIGNILSQLPRGKKTPLWGFAVHVKVVGKRDGSTVEHVLTTSHPPTESWGGDRAYAKMVGIPMSIGAQLIITGKTKVDSGPRTAFEVYDPAEFFKELKKRGIQIHEKLYEYRKFD
jgi:saccharopine dehydrogenase-like NADP-dependent oxidoreductase